MVAIIHEAALTDDTPVGGERHLTHADAEAVKSFALTAIDRLRTKYSIPVDCHDMKFLRKILDKFAELSEGQDISPEAWQQRAVARRTFITSGRS